MSVSFLKQAVVYSFCLLYLCACANYKHFDYEPNDLDEVSKTSLRIAVMAMEDDREYKRSGSIYYAYIPLIPTWGETKSDFQGNKGFEKAEYYYPGLVSYAINKDLTANRIAPEVHLNPALPDQYDIVIQGKLKRLDFQARKITYGLSALGALLQMVFLPTGSVSVDSEVEFLVTSPHRTTPLFKGTLRGDWANATYNWDEDSFLDEVGKARSRNKIHGVVTNFQEISEALIEAIQEPMREIENELDQQTRKYAYYTALDPSIDLLVQKISVAPSNVSVLKKLLRSKVRALEQYRLKESERLAKEDVIKKSLLEARLKLIRDRRSNILKIRAEQGRIEQQRSAIAGKQFSAALASVVQGVAAVKQGYQLPASSYQATSTTNLNSIPAYPAEELIASLDKTLPGFTGLGSDPFEKYGKISLPEIRKRFLRNYRNKFSKFDALYM